MSVGDVKGMDKKHSFCCGMSMRAQLFVIDVEGTDDLQRSRRAVRRWMHRNHSTSCGSIVSHDRL